MKLKKNTDLNLLILSGSPRKGGNTDLLVEAFVKGPHKSIMWRLFQYKTTRSILV